MTQEEFAKIVWTQWAKDPDGEIHPEELRPMRELELTGHRGSEFQDAQYAFTSYTVSYPDDDDPWIKDSPNDKRHGMEAVLGICMVLDNEGLFKLKESMVDIDETKIIKETDDDGKEIIVQQIGYRSVLPFISTFNKSVYDVIQKEHMRLQNDIGQSKYTKALLRFDTWFKANGFIEAHGHEIEPFWAKAYTGAVAINEPEREPPPLSDKDKWEDVLLELEMTESKGKMNLRVKHPNLAKGGVVLSLDNWQRKLRTMLYVIASMPSRLLNRETITDKLQLSDKKYAEKKSSVNKQDIHRLNNTLKYVIGITYDNPIQQMEKERGGARMMQQIGEHPVLPSIRLAKEFVSEQLNIDIDRDIEAMGQEDFDITDDANQEYSSQWLRCKPAWYKQN